MSAELVVRQATECFIPSETDWDFMLKWGSNAIKSGMLPAAIKSPEAAAIVVLKGREMGLSFMTAMAHIHIISGKPTMSAELIQGMARKNLPGLVINILESTNTIAKVEIIRPEKGAKPYVQSFTWEDAVSAKLTGKDVWKQYPAAMLWSRCVTAALRKVCPEALMGVSYTPEEMGANVDGDGNVIETTGRNVAQSPQVAQSTVTPIRPPSDSNSRSTEHLNAKSTESNKEVDKTVLLLKQELQKISALRVELQISTNDLKAEVWEMFKTDDANKLTLEQLKQVTAMLEQEKKTRAVTFGLGGAEKTAEWLKPEYQAPIG